MIDEKKLIEDFLNNYLVKNDGTWNDAMDRAVELTKTAPKVGEWIPCSERLPEEYIENLCCDIHGNFIVGFPTTNAVSNTGYAVETENEIMYECIAWMPLPEPYKAGDT